MRFIHYKYRSFMNIYGVRIMDIALPTFYEYFLGCYDNYVTPYELSSPLTTKIAIRILNKFITKIEMHFA